MLNVTVMFLECNQKQTEFVVKFGGYVKQKEYKNNSEPKQKEGVRKKEE
jgi:hypothetical protein